MAEQKLPFTNSPADPGLTDVLNKFGQTLMLKLNCHAIATVQSFDKNKRVVSATVNYKKTRFEKSKKTGKFEPIHSDYPILLDCPAVFLGGGESELTFPVQAGDECIILFNDRDIDNWFAGKPASPLASSRLHSISDGIAIVGLRSMGRQKPVDDSHAALSWGETTVAVSASKVLIKNESENLRLVLKDLIDGIDKLVNACSLITVTCAAPGNPSSPPINAAAITAVSSDLASVATKLQGLLE